MSPVILIKDTFIFAVFLHWLVSSWKISEEQEGAVN